MEYHTRITEQFEGPTNILVHYSCKQSPQRLKTFADVNPYVNSTALSFFYCLLLLS